MGKLGCFSHLPAPRDDAVRKQLLELLPLHVHGCDLHVRFEHLAADGLSVHCGHTESSAQGFAFMIGQHVLHVHACTAQYYT